MKTCIVCRTAKEDSEFNLEHIIPESLGSPELGIDVVCIVCNGKMGEKVDSKLVNAQMVQLARLSLDVRSKSGVTPNPFKSGTTDKDTGVPVRVNFNDEGKLASRVAPIPHHNVDESGNHQSRLAINADETGDRVKVKKQLQSLLKNNPAMKDQAVPNISDEQLDAVLAGGKVDLGNGVIIEGKHGQSSWFKQTMVWSNDDVTPAFIKMAYEFAYYWLGPNYLDDPVGKHLAKVLHDATKGQLVQADVDAAMADGHVGLGVKIKPFEFFNDLPNEHVAILAPTAEGVVVCLKIFNLVQAIVVVSRDAERYPTLELQCAVVDATTGATRVHSLESEVEHRLKE